MIVLELQCHPSEKDVVIAELWQRGSAGITEVEETEESCRLRAFFETADAAWLETDFAAWDAQASPAPEEDWIKMSQDAWEPFEVGKRFYFVPDWRDDPAPEGRIRIAINPGLACGTGWHESTQLSLEALEDYVKPGSIVIDVGCGSGILCEAAAALGAERVIGCDDDPAAVEIARQRFGGTVIHGPLDAVGETADIIVANINAPVCAALGPAIVERLRDGGTALLTGFEDHESDAVRTALENAGLRITAERVRGVWRLLEARL